MKDDVTASATVRLTLQITVPDSWGEGCSVGQVEAQAGRSAIELIERILSRRDFMDLAQAAAGAASGWDVIALAERLKKTTILADRIRIVGKPAVDVVIAKRS